VTRVGLVDSPRFDAHLTGECPERPARLPAIRRTLDEQGLLDRLTAIAPADVDLSLLALVHDGAYVAHVDAFCAAGGGVIDDGDTVVGAESASIARLAAGGAVAAVEAVMAGKVDRAFALVRPPGHHALRDQAMGFCLFNNVALMAERARQLGAQRVMILDWDVHHANGTQAAFADRNDVMVLSWQQDKIWPYSGLLSETGTGAGTGYTLNLPMPSGAGDGAYLQTWREVVTPVMARFRPDLLLLSAGFDAHWQDPLAQIQLTVSGYARMAKQLVELAQTYTGGKLVAVLEGGYDLDGLRLSAAATIRQLLDADGSAVDPLGETPHGSIAQVDDLVREIRQAHPLLSDLTG
jgi:acetoin utilization deacetylase AcuC-like enzyme